MPIFIDDKIKRGDFTGYSKEKNVENCIESFFLKW